MVAWSGDSGRMLAWNLLDDVVQPHFLTAGGEVQRFFNRLRPVWLRHHNGLTQVAFAPADRHTWREEGRVPSRVVGSQVVKFSLNLAACDAYQSELKSDEFISIILCSAV
ncbi:MAG: hypothetical protein P8N76_06065 [Pirellulaceae bacterium]|nr:hypothetical protein [Pirellulaceae bacterium]